MQINPLDNVRVQVVDGHKYALRDIAKGEDIIKYGQSIGHATQNIAAGEHVHSHNLRTNLSGKLEYRYTGGVVMPAPQQTELTFRGYLRENGDVGIRNDIWIINTVGCVNKVAETLSRLTGAKHFPHPYGCSQLGEDQNTTQLILKGLVEHPNAGGVLVLGLGCENNNIGAFQKVLGSWDPRRVKFLNVQDQQDEIEAGCKLIAELQDYARQARTEDVPISRLRIGLKCGGSDGLSGITANPLVGRICDRLTALGGSCVLTEVPEMFGAEHLLMQRCVDQDIFEKTVALINDFKDYYTRYDQVIYENPSPGNKAGGITTLEEKSLGCIQKGGLSPVTDVLTYGHKVTKPGLSLLNGPGNDMVAITNLAAVGVHLILFTTGRGTPLGGPVPTIKIATNRDLAQRKPHWIDYDASPLLQGVDLTEDLLSCVLAIANGQMACNEKNHYEEISIFKDGVTL